MGIAATAAPAQAQSTAKVSAETEPAPAQSDELRLATIGYRLTTANGDRCDRPDMATGLIFHDVGGYDADTRAPVTRAYGLGRGFGVLRRVAGSSADRAGLRPGDEIVALGGRDLADFAADAIAERASPLRTERFAALLGGALRQGPVSLTVKRGGALVAVSLEGEKACGGSFVAVPGGDLNAWADGRSVAVTARMMRFAADDQELAFVAAHEMAHNILRHASAQEDNGVARGKAAEIEADALAVELLARAGYDLTAPERFLRRSAKSQWLTLNISHPGNSRRIAIVNASIARLGEARLALASWTPPALSAAAGCAPAGAGPALPSTRAGDPSACLIAPTDDAASLARAPNGGDALSS